LADFGTVAVFNYDTFTTAIYKSWFGFFNLQAAAQLASLLLLFVALSLMAEKHSRGSRRYVQGARLQHRFRYPLKAWQKLGALGLCTLVLLVAFVAPLTQLLLWMIEEGLSMLDQRYFDLMWHTLLLGAMAAGLTVSLALLLAFSRRDAGKRFRAFSSVATLGYALPGSVLAVGVVLSFAEIDRYVFIPVQALLGFDKPTLLVGSVMALLAAYWVRFLAVAHGPVEAGLMRIRRSIPEAARSLGAGRGQVFWQIYLPMLRPGLLTAAVLVFVDVMKEMPATLLLRPYGWDTLAVRIYELTSEGEWERAALPAISLVLVGLLPVAQAMRQTTRR
jgi:iron(III) transport system permease protein